MPISTIELHELPAQHTAVVRRRIAMSEMSRLSQWFEQTLAAVRESGQEPAGMPFLRILVMDDQGMDVEVGWPVAAPFAGTGDVRGSTLPGGSAAVGTYHGPYDRIGPAYEAIQSWCREHGHEIAGPPWESYFTSPDEEPDPEKWRTDVHFPLAG